MRILLGVDHLGAVLHFGEEDEGLLRQDFLTACQHQILQEAVYILGGLKVFQRNAAPAETGSAAGYNGSGEDSGSAGHGMSGLNEFGNGPRILSTKESELMTTATRNLNNTPKKSLKSY